MAKKFKVEDLIKFPIAKNLKYWIIAPLAIAPNGLKSLFFLVLLFSNSSFIAFRK